MSDAGKAVFLLQGPEEGEKKQYIKNYVKKMTVPGEELPEVFRYYAFEVDIFEMIDLLYSGSLFSKYKIVILNNCDEIKKANEIEALCSYCEKPVHSTTLFLLSSTVNQVSKKISDRIPAKNKITFWELFENQKKGWIINYFKECNLRIEQAALDVLLEMVESNTHDLRQECQRLSLFYKAGSTITQEDIEKYLYHSKEENIYTLFERIAFRDFAGAIEVIQKIISTDETDPIPVMQGLFWQVKKLHVMKELIEANYPI